MNFEEQFLHDDFLYELPQSRIAQFPIENRDESKLLVAKKKDSSIEHHVFKQLASLLPKKSLLVRNNTKVIAARLHLSKKTGGKVELLCIEPITPNGDMSISLNSNLNCRWKCMIGGRNIHEGDVLYGTALQATIVKKIDSEAIVDFSWQTPQTFLEILNFNGEMPLPPYMKREATTVDKTRYQTVYAMQEGSVAAPTAGLHFTDNVIKSLLDNGIHFCDITLHVGLGTFQPIRNENLIKHDMHSERISIPLKSIEKLIEHSNSSSPSIVAIGTTSMRTLESLYWFGTKLYNQLEIALNSNTLSLSQWEPYSLFQENQPSLKDSFEAILNWATKKNLDSIDGQTSLMIVPGYKFKVADALITNFHQPRSTLILLVAAFLGKDFWREVYSEALLHDYRFLSYGDSSLLWR